MCGIGAGQRRDVIDRAIFTSVADLARKPMKYIRTYAKSAKPFPLDLYTTPERRIKAAERLRHLEVELQFLFLELLSPARYRVTPAH